jgi:NodT family efflux transporter outer membrane factor (OMF) lipoprotein
VAVLSSCRVGPDYHAPKPALPAAWSAVGGGTSGEPVTRLAQWWRGFNDPALGSLIQRAAVSNRDLRAAEARVRIVRALRGVAAADLLPTIDALASYATARRSRNALAFPVRLLDTGTYQAGFDATWEFDLFGGKRRAVQAARADLQAVEEDRRAVLVSLLAEVARDYIELRGTQRQLEIAEANLGAQREVLAISQLRFAKGLVSELDVAQAQALVAATRSVVPALETAIQHLIHRLSVLVGQPPGALAAELSTGAAIPPVPPEVPAGLPADLLRSRPDVRRSERQLAAANARIGVTTAELFPKFFLTGTAGYQSLNAANLISPASKFWMAGPSLQWRLLEYPRLRGQIRAADARQDEALAQFEQTVLNALEEVENALAAYGKEKERLAALRESAEASRRAVALANELYTKGMGEFLNVLIAQRALYQAEDAMVQSQKTVSENLVALYKALGGGWQTTSPPS